MILDIRLFALIKTKDLSLNYKIEAIDFRTREIAILGENGELEYHSFDDVEVFDGGVEKNIKIQVIEGENKWKGI